MKRITDPFSSYDKLKYAKEEKKRLVSQCVITNWVVSRCLTCRDISIEAFKECSDIWRYEEEIGKEINFIEASLGNRRGITTYCDENDIKWIQVNNDYIAAQLGKDIYYMGANNNELFKLDETDKIYTMVLMLLNI
jgi:hypothetical protein